MQRKYRYSAEEMLFTMFNNSFYKKWRRKTYPPRKKEDALQFFKEERTDSAVYKLYLKKVRYHTPASDADEPVIQEGRVSHLQWRTIELRVIKAGTVERIVDAVSMHETGELDSSYVNVLLATFRSFTTTKDLLDLLCKRYIELRDNTTMKQHVKEAHQKSVRTVISVWLDGYPDDFNEPLTYPCLQKLIEFAEQHIEGSDLAHRAKHRLHKFIANDESSVRGIEVEDVQFNFNLFDEINVQPEISFLPRPVEFEFVPDKIFAEQLTFMDMELFKKVVPHHCLGSVWSRREKKNVNAPSVYATINQFNAVSYRVIATILKHPDLHQEDRAAIIEKWIDIAHELRLLKNFSSLKAIISGLQSNPVYRLHKVWAEVDADSRLLFHELSAIFSEDNNHSMARELLLRNLQHSMKYYNALQRTRPKSAIGLVPTEGTAKFADMENTSMTLGRHQRKKSSTSTLNKKKNVWDPSYSTAAGTVPYLGTFLTDLTMVDTAYPDQTEEKWINFEKKRKEFEILAQIKLLQSACQLYQLKPDAAFIEWFHSIRTYDDNESYELSCEIEPATPSTPKEGIKGHRKKSSLGFFSPRQPAVSMDHNLSVSTPDQLDTMSVQSLSPSVTPDYGNSGKPMLRHSISVASLGSVDDIGIGATNPWKSPESRVVKVSLDTTESHHTNYYKSILLTNSDHTKNVLRKILIKFNVEANPDDFIMFQVWPEGELQIPEKGNVFYAINNSVPEIRFVVRKRSDIERIKNKQKKKKDKLTL